MTLLANVFTAVVTVTKAPTFDVGPGKLPSIRLWVTEDGTGASFMVYAHDQDLFQTGRLIGIGQRLVVAGELHWINRRGKSMMMPLLEAREINLLEDGKQSLVGFNWELLVMQEAQDDPDTRDLRNGDNE